LRIATPVGICSKKEEDVNEAHSGHRGANWEIEPGFDLDAFLALPLVARVAASGPSVRPVWFLWEERCFWWLTGSWSRLQTLLKRSPQVALVIDTCDLQTGRVLQVIASGNATVEPFGLTSLPGMTGSPPAPLTTSQRGSFDLRLSVFGPATSPTRFGGGGREEGEVDRGDHVDCIHHSCNHELRQSADSLARRPRLPLRALVFTRLVGSRGTLARRREEVA
jgi:hypothetical protein